MATRVRTAPAGATRTAGALLRRFPIIIFFLMAHGFTWLAIAPLLLARGGPGQAEFPVELIQIVGALAGPALAGVLVIGLTGGRAAIGHLLRRLVQGRVGLVWYLILVFGPLFALTLTATFLFGTSFAGDFVRSLTSLPTRYLPVLIVGIILGPLWEEIGWRGVALPRLQQRLGPLVGTAILGVLWAVWHLPGYIGGWLGAFTPSAFLALIVGSVGFSVLMTWVFNHVEGSLLIMVLLHSASNASIAFGGPLLPESMSPGIRVLVQNGWIPAITYAAWGLAIALATRRRLGYPKVQA